MFDLRYHVLSLAAIFIALVVGIVIGVGISGSGFVEESERRNLNRRIDDLERRLDEERRRTTEQNAAAAFVEAAYATVMNDRLRGREIAVVFVGSVDPRRQSAVVKAVTDADGRPIRLRAIRVPVDAGAMSAVLDRRPAVAGYAGDEQLAELGAALGRELVAGGKTPLWDALTRELVEERSGSSEPPADGVVIIRSVAPQRGETARFLTGLYEGLQGAVPAVGVDTSTAGTSAIPAFRRAGLSTVDNVETRVGRVALAVLLAGGLPGSYGAGEQSVVPPIEPVQAPQPGE